MISIVITTFKEPETLKQALIKILKEEIREKYEILVVGPDKETENVAWEFSQHYTEVKYLKDPGEGKPAALNLAFEKAQGDVIISTDGDVIIGSDAINQLVSVFKDPRVGVASGQPLSVNLRNTLLGYWSHFLTAAAHQTRSKKKIWPCSGYLYAFRNIIKEIPKESFSEDGLITEIIRQKKYKIKYVSKAKVYVKYPTNLKDWFRQKIRSAGGYSQIFTMNNGTRIKTKKMRNIIQEIKDGALLFITYPRNLKEYLWTILLFLNRIILWLVIFWKIKIKKSKFSSIWKRVESTK